ncbi:hypothetical protein D3C87_2159500 [compost metagenome]
MRVSSFSRVIWPMAVRRTRRRPLLTLTLSSPSAVRSAPVTGSETVPLPPGAEVKTTLPLALST